MDHEQQHDEVEEEEEQEQEQEQSSEVEGDGDSAACARLTAEDPAEESEEQGGDEMEEDTPNIQGIQEGISETDGEVKLSSLAAWSALNPALKDPRALTLYSVYKHCGHILMARSLPAKVVNVCVIGVQAKTDLWRVMLKLVPVGFGPTPCKPVPVQDNRHSVNDFRPPIYVKKNVIVDAGRIVRNDSVMTDTADSFDELLNHLEQMDDSRSLTNLRNLGNACEKTAAWMFTDAVEMQLATIWHNGMCAEVSELIFKYKLSLFGKVGSGVNAWGRATTDIFHDMFVKVQQVVDDAEIAAEEADAHVAQVVADKAVMVAAVLNRVDTANDAYNDAQVEISQLKSQLDKVVRKNGVQNLALLKAHETLRLQDASRVKRMKTALTSVAQLTAQLNPTQTADVIIMDGHVGSSTTTADAGTNTDAADAADAGAGAGAGTSAATDADSDDEDDDGCAVPHPTSAHRKTILALAKIRVDLQEARDANTSERAASREAVVTRLANVVDRMAMQDEHPPLKAFPIYVASALLDVDYKYVEGKINLFLRCHADKGKGIPASKAMTPAVVRSFIQIHNLIDNLVKNAKVTVDVGRTRGDKAKATA